MKIYLVEHGDYSDYHIVGIFSTREAAEQLCLSINRTVSEDDHASIDERELDPCLEQLRDGLSLFAVTLNTDGSERMIREGTSRIEDSLWSGSNAAFYVWGFLITVWARDQSHALKIASERRRQMLAEGKGYQPPSQEGR